MILGVQKQLLQTHEALVQFLCAEGARHEGARDVRSDQK